MAHTQGVQLATLFSKLAYLEMRLFVAMVFQDLTQSVQLQIKIQETYAQIAKAGGTDETNKPS